MAAKVDCRGTIEERFHSRYRVDEMTRCWNWTGALSAGSYGSIYKDGRMQKAHRVSYELLRGAIPHGLQLDHLCRNRRCVNPAHLEPVTASENILRSPLLDRQSHKTHCPSGHPYSGDNLIIRKTGWRACLTCRKSHTARWNAIRAQEHG